MKKIFVTLLLAAAALTASAQALPLRSGGDTLPFKGGEEFGYKLHYKWGIINSDVAYATIGVDSTVYKGVPAYSARIFGQSSKFYDTFFKVREDFRSTFDANLVPLHFWRDTREGNWHCQNDATYDWSSSTASFMPSYPVSRDLEHMMISSLLYPESKAFSRKLLISGYSS